MECSILSEVDDTSFSGRGSPRRYGRPLNWLPASRLLPRAAGWSAATLCFGTKLQSAIRTYRSPPEAKADPKQARCLCIWLNTSAR